MPAPDMNRCMDNKEKMLDFISSLYKPIKNKKISNPQKFINDIHQFGQLLSESFDGAGEQVNESLQTGVLAEQIADIVGSHKDLFPKAPQISDNIQHILALIEDEHFNLFTNWADSHSYNSSADKDNYLIHAALDNFKKGLYSLFVLINYEPRAQTGKTQFFFRNYLFKALIAREKGQELIRALEPTGPLLEHYRKITVPYPLTPLIKLNTALICYKNLEINYDQLIIDITEALSTEQNTNDNNDSLAETSSVCSSCEELPESNDVNLTIQQQIKNQINRLTLEHQRITHLQKIKLNLFKDSLQKIEPGSPRVTHIDAIMDKYVKGHSTLNITKKEFHDFYKQAQKTELNTKAKDSSPRKLISMLNIFTKNKTSIMDRARKVNCRLVDINKTPLNKMFSRKIIPSG